MQSDNCDNKNLKFWQAYIKTVKPLHKGLSLKETETVSLDNIIQKPTDLPIMTNLANKNSVASSKAPLLNEKINQNQHFKAEKNAKKRMKKGDFIYDAKIDLHGQTQTQAFDNLLKFVTHNYHTKIRHLLIITGRGRYCYKTLSPLGILIKKVPEWLKSPPFAQMISVIETASNADGGEGALYVILRK